MKKIILLFFILSFISCATLRPHIALQSGKEVKKPEVKPETKKIEAKPEVKVEAIKPVVKKPTAEVKVVAIKPEIKVPDRPRSLNFTTLKFPGKKKTRVSITQLLRPKTTASITQIKKQERKTVKYLFIPLAMSHSDLGLIGSNVYSLADVFDYDFVVFTGNNTQLASILPFFNEKYKSYLSRYGVIFSRENGEAIEKNIIDFSDYIVCIAQDSDIKMIDTINKPMFVFSSIGDLFIKDKLIENQKTREKKISEWTEKYQGLGFIDTFDSLRYSVPFATALHHNGLTYEDDDNSERLDFVFSRSVIPVSCSLQFVNQLSNTEGCRRFAIKGEGAI